MVKDIRTDGEDPVPYGSMPYDLTAVNGIVFFTADNAVDGEKLWRSDGTEEGTRMLIWPGNNKGLYARNLTACGGSLFFIRGLKLWKSDGTEQGTVMVKDIRTGSDSSSPSSLTPGNGMIYFVANRGADGRELWKSDGTEQGTVMVKDIRFRCGQRR